MKPSGASGHGATSTQVHGAHVSVANISRSGKPGSGKDAGKAFKQCVETLAQDPDGEPVALLGSSGFIEIAVNKGNAARALNVARGAEVVLQLS